jgi:type I restriction enzyme S subunit
MKLETFFEKFDQFADAPGAVAKMRELVLELAVQGKLVGQDPKDDSADELLRQIELTRSRTGKTANGRKLERLPPVEPDDSPFEIPHGWAWCPLGNLGLIGSSCRVHEKDWTTTGVPFLRAREIVKLAKAGTVNNDLFITEEHYRRLAGEGLIPEPDDIMITGVGTIGVPYIVRDADRFYFKDASVLILKNCFHLYPHYLHLVMQSPYWVREVHKESMGTTVHTLTIVRAKQTPIPLPPLAEQKRIVAKVDELMTLCDRLEAQQQERETRHAALARASLARFADEPAPANLDFLFHKSYAIPPADLRKSILTLAVQGKLVPQDPNDEEPEVALLELHRARTRQAKAGKLRAAKVPVNAFLEDSLRFSPDSWRTVSFDHVAVAHNYALKAGPFGSALKKEFYVEKGYKIYGQEQVIAGDPFIGDYYIDEKKFAELESCAVSPGDILISLVGTIGRILVLPEGIEPGIINPRVIKLSLDDSLVHPMFIKVLIGSPYAVDFFEENSHGGTMNILNLSILRALPIPLPALAEQRRIVAKVDQLMALVDELEIQLAASRATAAKLLDALVAELTSSTANA